MKRKSPSHTLPERSYSGLALSWRLNSWIHSSEGNLKAMAGPPEGLYSAGQGADVLARQLYLLRVGSDLRGPSPVKEAALNDMRETILGGLTHALSG